MPTESSVRNEEERFQLTTDAMHAETPHARGRTPGGGGTNEPLAGRCAARLRTQPGKYCPNYPVTGRTRCRMQGGKSLAGIASPTFKTGRYSRMLPTAIAAPYKALRADPRMLELTSEIGIIDLLTEETLSRRHSNENAAGSTGLWRELQDLHERFARARARGDMGTMSTVMSRTWEVR